MACKLSFFFLFHPCSQAARPIILDDFISIAQGTELLHWVRTVAPGASALHERGFFFRKYPRIRLVCRSCFRFPGCTFDIVYRTFLSALQHVIAPASASSSILRCRKTWHAFFPGPRILSCGNLRLPKLLSSQRIDLFYGDFENHFRIASTSSCLLLSIVSVAFGHRLAGDYFDDHNFDRRGYPLRRRRTSEAWSWTHGSRNAPGDLYFKRTGSSESARRRAQNMRLEMSLCLSPLWRCRVENLEAYVWRRWRKDEGFDGTSFEFQGLDGNGVGAPDTSWEAELDLSYPR